MGRIESCSYRYGPHGAQVVELVLPPRAAAGVRGVVAMIHGGFWRARYDRTLQDAVARDLARAGWAVWNVDYRGVPPGPNDGGGWPSTQLDVAAGLDLLPQAAAEHGLAGAVAAGVTVIGHSAGGCLALWAAARHRLPAGAPGADPGLPAGAPGADPGARPTGLRPTGVIAQAAVCDLVAGAGEGLGAGAIEAMMGGPFATARQAYALASPAALLPVGVPVLLVTGADDDVVPARQAHDFAAAARAAGDDVTVEIVPGEDHFAHLDASSASWLLARSWLEWRGSGSDRAREEHRAREQDRAREEDRARD